MMLYELVNRFPEDMIFNEDGPLVSLYQPTHRVSPDNKQDPIVFKNLLSLVEKSLEESSDQASAQKILKSLKALKEDKEFWIHAFDGMAVFASANKCLVFKLETPVKELAVVAKSFHIKPLIKAHQATESYHLLGLSRENFTLYEGNRYGIKEVEIGNDKPRTLEEVLGSQTTDPHLSYGAHDGAGANAMYHGHGDVQEEIDLDTEKYFRYVDGFIYDAFSKESKRPLILIALKEYHSEFKKISKNPFLMTQGVNKSIDSLDLNEIKEEIQDIITGLHRKKTEEMIQVFKNAKADGLGSSDLEEIAKAALASRVDTILLEDDRIIPGKIDYKTGQVDYGDISSPEYDDLLDDLAELVLSNGGSVVVLEKEGMPSNTGIAAIYRYK